MQICCSTHSVILNATATQDTCSLKGTCHPQCTVKSSLFTHEHSTPLSVAARLHRCGTDCSRYINNGWAFSRQTSWYYLVFTSLFFLSFFFRKSLFLIDFLGELGREGATWIYCSTYLCIHWLLLVCALTRDQTQNFGVIGTML